MGHAPEFEDALGLVDQGLRNGIKHFAIWFSKNWLMTREEWIKAYDAPLPDGDYFDGFNAGVESVLMACETFLDEELR
jgi:hypothetical protein